MRSRSSFTGVAIFSLFLLFFSALRAQDDGNLIPHGSFEDSSEVRGLWEASYGQLRIEDSISLKGGLALGLEEEEEGHIDVFIEGIRPEQTGQHQLSFWYRAHEGHEEAAPFWVEVMQNGKSVQVFRPGTEKARTRKLSRDWILFTGEFQLLDPAPVKVFIHSDLPQLWLDDVGLKRTSY
jgi:hypothetical protein